jgi:23S rRNA (adenine-N6)-dimethyltransferase
VAGRPPLAPNPAGAHFLHDRALIAQLARACGAGDGQLVLDLGAGLGAITAGLAARGARVIAVERDPRLAAALRRRFGHDPRVRVVEADLRTVPLPRREFLVVASPPFSLTTALCRRLLGDPACALAGAELVIGRGAARWLSSQRPRDRETAWWAGRYEMRLARRVSAAAFAPPPRADVAWLSVRPRPIVASGPGQRQLRTLLRAVYRRPGGPVGAVLPGRRRLLLRAGLDPRTPAAEVTADQWHDLALLLAGEVTRPARHRPARRSADLCACPAGAARRAAFAAACPSRDEPPGSDGPAQITANQSRRGPVPPVFMIWVHGLQISRGGFRGSSQRGGLGLGA